MFPFNKILIPWVPSPLPHQNMTNDKSGLLDNNQFYEYLIAKDMNISIACDSHDWCQNLSVIKLSSNLFEKYAQSKYRSYILFEKNMKIYFLLSRMKISVMQFSKLVKWRKMLHKNVFGPSLFSVQFSVEKRLMI